MAEFFSTNYTSLIISKYLQTTNHIYEKYSKSVDTMCSIVVTDFSYALINSVLKSFNNCQLSHYILWTYHVLIEFPNDKRIGHIMKIKIYFCSAHFLKTLIYKVKKIEKNMTVAKSFIFAFSLLQNSITVESFNNNLRNIYYVFSNSMLDESVLLSIIYLKVEISNRKLSHLKISKKSL